VSGVAGVNSWSRHAINSSYSGGKPSGRTSVEQEEAVDKNDQEERKSAPQNPNLGRIDPLSGKPMGGGFDFFELSDEVSDGVAKAAGKGWKATGEAFKEGLKAAGQASKEVVNQYRSNEGFRNAFNTAIAAGMAPKAAAAYAVGGGPAMANAYRTAMQRGAAKAATIPGFERGINEVYDFATAQDPTSLPAQSIGGQLGGFASGWKDFRDNVGKLYGCAKSKFAGVSNGTKR